MIELTNTKPESSRSKGRRKLHPYTGSFKQRTKFVSILRETKEKLELFHSRHPELKLLHFCDNAINKAMENYDINNQIAYKNNVQIK